MEGGTTYPVDKDPIHWPGLLKLKVDLVGVSRGVCRVWWEGGHFADWDEEVEWEVGAVLWDVHHRLYVLGEG